MTTYNKRFNAQRAARSELKNTAAQEGVDFTTYKSGNGEWTFRLAAIESPKPKSSGLAEATDALATALIMDAAPALAAPKSVRAVPISQVREPKPAKAPKADGAPRGPSKVAQLLEAAKSPAGISYGEMRERTGWTKLGGFFTAAKKAGLTLRKVRADGDTRFFVDAPA